MLPEGLEYWRGYFQSLRPTQMGLSLNIGTSSIFFFIGDRRSNLNIFPTFYQFGFFLCYTSIFHVTDVSARAYYKPILMTEFVAKHVKPRDVSKPMCDKEHIKVLFTAMVNADFYLSI